MKKTFSCPSGDVTFDDETGSFSILIRGKEYLGPISIPPGSAILCELPNDGIALGAGVPMRERVSPWE